MQTTCRCVGCAPPGSAAASPPHMLGDCARETDAAPAPASLVVAAAGGRGALLLGSIAGATSPGACLEALAFRGQVSLIVQCAVSHAGRARAEFARKGVPVDVLELRLEDAEGFTGAPAAFAMGSGPGQDLGAAFATALPRIEAARARGEHVLVSCAAGRSRSASVLLAHLMCGSEHLTLAAALAAARGARPCVGPNRGFVAQLLRLEFEEAARASAAAAGDGAGAAAGAGAVTGAAAAVAAAGDDAWRSSVPEEAVLQLFERGRVWRSDAERDKWRGCLSAELRHFVAHGPSVEQVAAAAAEAKQGLEEEGDGGSGGGGGEGGEVGGD